MPSSSNRNGSFMPERRLGIRWTIGDVSAQGFEALQVSLWSAWRLFGGEAAYAVTVNTIGLEEARARTGAAPETVVWHAAGGVPGPVEEVLDEGMAEGVAWKLAPLRLFEDRYELSLDNDCILWAIPEAMRKWLDEPEPRCLIAADGSPTAPSKPLRVRNRAIPESGGCPRAAISALRCRPCWRSPECR
jgi:hypothetical protein